MVKLTLTNYQSKSGAQSSLALFGESYRVKQVLKDQGGRYSKGLTNPTTASFERDGGWIFTVDKKEQLLGDKRLNGIVYVESDWKLQPETEQSEKATMTMSPFLALFDSYEAKEILKAKYNATYIKKLRDPITNAEAGAWIVPAHHKEALLEEFENITFVGDTSKKRKVGSNDSDFDGKRNVKPKTEE